MLQRPCCSSKTQWIGPFLKEKSFYSERTSCILFFFFFSFWPPCGIWKFQGQRWNPRRSCSPCHSWGNTGSFNPLNWAGDWICIPALHRCRSCCVTARTPMLPLLQHQIHWAWVPKIFPSFLRAQELQRVHFPELHSPWPSFHMLSCFCCVWTLKEASRSSRTMDGTWAPAVTTLDP